MKDDTMKDDILHSLRLESRNGGACAGGRWSESPGEESIISRSPIDGRPIASVSSTAPGDYERAVCAAQETFLRWRETPAPSRGRIAAELAAAFLEKKEDLARIITLETGKIHPEAAGEAMRMEHIFTMAAGFSRSIGGRTLPAERPGRRLLEQWHPLGPVGVITSFNFPVMVWAWNAAVAMVCGNPVIWKPSTRTPLCAIAVQKIANDVLEKHDLGGLLNLVIGDRRSVGKWMAKDRRLPLISATGSVSMGRALAVRVAARLGKTILELGGNNAMIVDGTTDLENALRHVLVSATATAGQRCISTRRLILDGSIAEEFTARLVGVYKQLKIGDPFEPGVHVGPLVDGDAVDIMLDTVERALEHGGKLLCGGKRIDGLGSDAYVEPAVMKVAPDNPVLREETFAPLLYVVEAGDGARDGNIDEAIKLNNGVSQGLSSALFTESLANAERFLSASGSDCGMAYVNEPTFGADIGGAFGGEKESGGGRESGSDVWKQYMRRQTVIVNSLKDAQELPGIDYGERSVPGR